MPLHFRLIVTGIHYLSMQAITVHLLSGLPASDHGSSQSALLSAYGLWWRRRRYRALRRCQMHALMENSSRDGCAFILDWLRTVVDSTVNGHSRSGFLVEHNSACQNSSCNIMIYVSGGSEARSEKSLTISWGPHLPYLLLN